MFYRSKLSEDWRDGYNFFSMIVIVWVLNDNDFNSIKRFTKMLYLILYILCACVYWTISAIPALILEKYLIGSRRFETN